ncbi:hypothetical protein GOA93_06175 [Sinorhizobium meliloti]|nr:hypothetical protein [Sinorhizobium meliloti]
MTEAFAIMIIWFGSGKYAQFDAERYNSMAECQAAKKVIASQYADTWSPIDPNDIVCREVHS